MSRPGWQPPSDEQQQLEQDFARVIKAFLQHFSANAHRKPAIAKPGRAEQERLARRLEDLLYQGQELGTAWAKEMLGRSRERVMGTGGLTDLLGKAWDIVTGIIDHIEQVINDLLGVEIDDGVDPQALVDEAFSGLLIDMPGMWAETEMQTIVQQAVYIELAAQADIPNIQWMANPDACHLCLGFADMGAVPLGTDFGGNPYPPAHPHCRCHLELVSAKMTESEEEEEDIQLVSKMGMCQCDTCKERHGQPITTLDSPPYHEGCSCTAEEAIGIDTL